MNDVLPDVEGLLRTYLRADSGVAALVAQRVFFGVPRGAVEADFPMVVVSRVGGGDDGSDAPVDVATVQIDCWGSLNDRGIPLKATATGLVNTVRSALRAVGIVTPLSADTEAGCSVETVLWLPDPDNDRPRYVITAQCWAIRT